jgi:hypothetical protein
MDLWRLVAAEMSPADLLYGLNSVVNPDAVTALPDLPDRRRREGSSEEPRARRVRRA